MGELDLFFLAQYSPAPKFEKNIYILNLFFNFMLLNFIEVFFLLFAERNICPIIVGVSCFDSFTFNEISSRAPGTKPVSVNEILDLSKFSLFSV